jgi:hypothetical protein
VCICIYIYVYIHICILVYICIYEIKEWNPFYNCFKGAGSDLVERNFGGDLTNIQRKPIENCHNNSPIQQIYAKINENKDTTKKRAKSLFIMPLILLRCWNLPGCITSENTMT